MSKIMQSNLTAITWAHAVNSQDRLTKALHSTIEMIEADIVMGTLNSTGPDIPIMAHPPENSSDLSLLSFLQQIEQYNMENDTHMKGVKLDFKSIEVFEGSLGILADKIPQMTCPVWMNADIVPGPVNQTTTTPVDPKRFFKGCSQFEKSVLSIGWTTKWSSVQSDGSYTPEQTEAMLKAIEENNITVTGQAITFPVRAGMAANSVVELHKLVGVLNDTNDCTLTIWSSPNDYVDVEKLEDLIFSFGLDRIYLDVPEELSQKLNLSRKDENTVDSDENSSSGNTMVSSLVNFSLMSAGLFLLSLFMERFHA